MRRSRGKSEGAGAAEAGATGWVWVGGERGLGVVCGSGPAQARDLKHGGRSCTEKKIERTAPGTRRADGDSGDDGLLSSGGEGREDGVADGLEFEGGDRALSRSGLVLPHHGCTL